MELRRSELEALSTSELAALACRLGLGIAAALNRNAILDELLELALDESSEQAPLPAAPPVVRKKRSRKPAKTPKRVTKPLTRLPEHYNASVIYAIVRDPLWVFVFWELLAGVKKNMEAGAAFEGYYLKIAQWRPEKKNFTDTYTISVNTDDTAWYLHFAPKGGTFRVALCARANNSEITLATSAMFAMPNILHLADAGTHKDELWLLSGIHDFDVLKNTESRRHQVPFRVNVESR
ncbi:MAG: DUF4912 domain-containing protein [Spirochaetaceae bacterium]|jgi:hypothetical protein|nr:DUF4912 domain-containing protein [Spirochaetaceae bacterium]